jgi:predicted transcriptional regulator
VSTTSLKLPAELKERASAAARERGLSAHAFMIEAIEGATLAAEQRALFVADALSAREATVKSGLGFDVDAVHAWLRARVAGTKGARRPKAKRWRG